MNQVDMRSAFGTHRNVICLLKKTTSFIIVSIKIIYCRKDVDKILKKEDKSKILLTRLVYFAFVIKYFVNLRYLKKKGYLIIFFDVLHLWREKQISEEYNSMMVSSFAVISMFFS